MQKSLVLKVLCLIFCSSIWLNAQEQEQLTYTISGIVEEESSKEKVIGLTIALFNLDTLQTRPVTGAYSNKFGFYSIPKVKPGSYRIVARGIGYNTFAKEIVVNNSDVRVDIAMQKVDVKLQELEVTAERYGTTRDISSVDIATEFIQKMPTLGGEADIFRSLQFLPGVQQASEIASGLYIRGSSPDQNLILLDGVIVYNPYHLFGFLSAFNSDAIRNTRLIKGAFPAEYGGRLAAVVDMQMKEGTKEKFSGSGAINLISGRLTLEGPINENSSYMVSGRHFTLDLLTSLTPNDAPRYFFSDFNAKVNYKLSDADHLFVSGYFGQDILTERQDRSSDSQFGIDWGNSTLNARWMRILQPNLFSNFSAIYTRYNFGSTIEEGRRSDEDRVYFRSASGIEDYTLKGELQYSPNSNHIIKSGLEGVYHNFRAFASVGNDFLDDALDFLGRDGITAWEVSAYIQDEWQATENLSTNIGTRFFYFGSGDYLALEPRISAVYSLTPTHRLKGAFAVAHQFLHLIERFDISLPTDLWFPSTANTKPSKSIQYVFGYEQDITPEYSFSIETYYKDMLNLLEYREDASFSLGIPLENQFTSGRGFAYGAEFFVQKKLGNITGWIGYTWARTRRIFEEINNGNEFSPRYDRTHDINIVANYEINKRWEISMAWVYGTGQAFTMPSSTYAFHTTGGPISGEGRVNANGTPLNRGGSSYWYNSEKQNYTERNGSRLPAFHRLDLNFMYNYIWLDIPWTFSLNIYNAYNRLNPFMWYVDDNRGYSEQGKKELKQVTIFPIIPTFGFAFKF